LGWGFVFGLVFGFEVEGYRRENAGGGFACDEVLRRRHEDVNVFGVREVGEEGQDAAERSPIAEDAEGFSVGGSEEMRECGGEGLECVGSFDGEPCSCSDGSTAYVEEDEGGDDEGVASDFGVSGVFVEEGSWVEAEVLAAGESEAADDERDDSEEDQEAEDVGDEVVGCADQVCGGDGKWQITFDGVDEVDEAVEDEAVEDEGVKKADGRALFEGAALKECCGEGVSEAAGKIVETGFGVGRASSDAEIEAIEALEAQCESDEGEDEEGDLVREWKHSFVFDADV
jgi:hypothetical protein